MSFFITKETKHGSQKLLVLVNFTLILELLIFPKLLDWSLAQVYIRQKESLVHLLEPTLFDFVMKSERKTQIIYPKDLGYIAARTGLQSGFKILEVGTGSAALTTYFAGLVKPEGHIFTYDVNEEFMRIAEEKSRESGLGQICNHEEIWGKWIQREGD